jgi:hypothetical protein
MSGTRVKGIIAIAAFALTMGIAPPAQAATFPVTDYWDCDVWWVKYTAASSTSLSIDPHLLYNARAVMQRYYAGTIVNYYGPWVHNTYSTNHATSTVTASNGTWVADYWQYQQDGGMHLLYNGGAHHQICT